MIALPDKTKSHFNCLEACVASILYLQDKDYIPIFTHSWRMKYEPIQKDIKLLIEKYCSAKFVEKTFHDYNSFKKYVEVSLKFLPEERNNLSACFKTMDLPVFSSFTLNI